MGSVATTTPLPASYARLGAVSALDVHVGTPSGDDGGCRHGWVTGHQLVNDPARRAALIEAELAHARAWADPPPRRDVAATWVFQHYLWAVGMLTCGPLLLDRRVPVLGLADIALYMPFAGSVGAVVPPTTFHCMPDDPYDTGGVRSDARVQPTWEALCHAARNVVADHVAALMPAFAPELRRGPWALWSMATDQLVGALWYLGRLLGDEESGVATARTLLPGQTPPFAGGADFTYREQPDGTTSPERTRLSCCLLYTVAPGSVCATCPRLRAERGHQPSLASAGHHPRGVE